MEAETEPPCPLGAPQVPAFLSDNGTVDDLTREFLLESQEGLDRMERCLTELESHPTDAGLLAEIFRAVHTIKGTTGFLGFAQLEALSHSGENLLGELRDGRLAAPRGRSAPCAAFPESAQSFASPEGRACLRRGRAAKGYARTVAGCGAALAARGFCKLHRSGLYAARRAGAAESHDESGHQRRRALRAQPGSSAESLTESHTSRSLRDILKQA